MKVLITGCESFIGKVLCAELKNKQPDWEIIGIDQVRPTDRSFIQSDICDENLTDQLPNKIDAVVHLAAISRHQDCIKSLTKTIRINVEGTLNVYKAAANNGAHHFIFASTEWVYGDHHEEQLVSENNVIDAAALCSPYALSKWMAECGLRIAQQDSYCGITVLRFAIVYGARTQNLSAVESLFFQTEQRSEIEVGSIKTARRYIHVRDVANGIYQALCQADKKQPEAYQIYNLAGNDLITLEDVIAESEKILGKEISINETNPSGVTIRNPDPSKAKRELNWESTVTLSEGLQELSHLKCTTST